MKEHELEPMLAVIRGRIKDAELLLRELKEREKDIAATISKDVSTSTALSSDE